MNKLIFRKLFYDVLSFFLISSLCITIIIWVVQAVNYLDIVAEDGHGLKTYFIYTFLSLPKIFSRTIIFVFFISIFYTLNKYDSSNEILVFWNNGIKKINFINFILKCSVIFIIIQITFNLYVVPSSQNLGRTYLKKSNIDFLPKLISEKKFIDVARNLTIFIENYSANGNFEKIYIKEVLGKNSSKIITANYGKVLKKNEKYFLKLNKGGITNIEKKNTYSVNFLTTEYDLSKFSSKTVTQKKIQETDTVSLIDCLKQIYFMEGNKTYISEICNNKSVTQVSQEMFKRSIIPLYILIVSLIASSLIIKPKNIFFQKYHKFIMFMFGILLIVFSQISIKLVGKNFETDFIFSIFPFILVFIYYFLLFIKNNFSFKKL